MHRIMGFSVHLITFPVPFPSFLSVGDIHSIYVDTPDGISQVS